MSPIRPATRAGLQALGRSAIYANWLAHEDARQPVATATDVPPNERVLRHTVYAEAREALEEELRALLVSGKLLASGIREGSDGRVVMKPSLWKQADFSPDFDDVYANAMTFMDVEYFEATELPANIEEPPEWLMKHLARMAAQQPPVPQFTPDYRHVSIGELKFVFGGLQAEVVRYLHSVAADPNPWRPGKVILEEIGSQSTKISELFKHQKGWRTLIESDGRGKYRLKI